MDAKYTMTISGITDHYVIVSDVFAGMGFNARIDWAILAYPAKPGRLVSYECWTHEEWEPVSDTKRNIRGEK